MIKKNILILGATGFIGQIFVNILQKKNNITLIGSSGDINLLIGENITESIKELVRKNDLIIFDHGTLNLMNILTNILQQSKRS